LSKFSFPKTSRILNRADFIRLAKSGNKIHSDCFIAAVSKSEYGHVRIGITVTKKVGNAVVRNRIKRFVREYFRLNRQKITGSWDINIIAKKKVANLTSLQTFKALQTIFEKTAMRIQ